MIEALWRNKKGRGNWLQRPAVPQTGVCPKCSRGSDFRREVVFGHQTAVFGHQRSGAQFARAPAAFQRFSFSGTIFGHRTFLFCFRAQHFFAAKKAGFARDIVNFSFSVTIVCCRLAVGFKQKKRARRNNYMVFVGCFNNFCFRAQELLFSVTRVLPTRLADCVGHCAKSGWKRFRAHNSVT